MRGSSTTRAHGAMLLFSALVAGSFSLGHVIANDISPAALTAMRFFLAVLVMGVWVGRSGQISRDDLRASWRYFLLGGLMGIYFVMMFEGLKTASAVSTAAVFTLTPVISGVFAFFILGQIVTRRVAAALLMGALGAVWVIFRADFNALVALEIGRGEAIYFLGCLAHALYTPLVPKLNRGQSPVVFTFGMMVAALLLMSVYSIDDLRKTEFLSLRPMIWVTLVYLAVCASAASLITVVGAQRFINRYGVVLIHQLKMGIEPSKYLEIKDQTDNADTLMRIIQDIYLENTNLTKEKLNELLMHDWWLNSTLCKEYGIIDIIM